jgi:hypothetical protein
MNCIKNVLQAEKYIKRIDCLVFQVPIVIILMTIAGIGVASKNDDGDAANALNVVKAVFLLVGISAELHFVIYCSCIPALNVYKIAYKFIVLEAGMFFIAVQPFIILGLASAGIIADNANFSSNKIMIYTNDLMLCSEMLVIQCCLFFRFPTSDFYMN